MFYDHEPPKLSSTRIAPEQYPSSMNLLAFSMSLKLLAKYDDFHRGLGQQEGSKYARESAPL